MVTKILPSDAFVKLLATMYRKIVPADYAQKAHLGPRISAIISAPKRPTERHSKSVNTAILDHRAALFLLDIALACTC